MGRFIRFLLTLVVLVLGGLAAYGLILIALSPSPDEIRELARRPSVLVRDGDLFPPHAIEFAYPLYLELNQIPHTLVAAIIAAEDKRFRSHIGIDLRGVARATVETLRGHPQGGSTITQQLAKNLLLSKKNGRWDKFWRKSREIPLALYLELVFTKNEILEMYLNRVFFGNHIFGIAAASRYYFGLKAVELSPLQAAMLARTVRGPSESNPHKNRPDLERRARALLSALVAAGTIADLDSKRRQVPQRRTVWKPRHHYYGRDYALQRLTSVHGLATGDRDLVVYTTLDPELQLYAELAVDRALAQRRRYRFDQIALVAMTPDGAVKAMVGGASYSASPWNRATAAHRQPGSAFKPVVYLAALENGFEPQSVIADLPVEIGGYRPRNIDRRFLGRISLSQALVLSRNVATVRLSEAVGRDKVIAMARRLGIEGELPDDPSLALGSGAVTLIDLVEAFAAIANGGRRVDSWIIEAVRSESGNFLYRNSTRPGPRVASKDSVCTLIDMLARVVSAHGTGHQAAFDYPSAGKTGTSQDYRDAWFVGFTRHLVAGIWMGNDDDSPTMRMTGSDLAARTWKNFMANAHLGRPPEPLVCGR